jgi:ATP-dependent DNA helicase RecQ
VIAFIDTEIEPWSRKVVDIGGVKDDGSTFHKASVAEFTAFISGSRFLCGHNIIDHDAKYIGSALAAAGIDPSGLIDTLHLSPLLFPARPYHALLKDDKLQSREASNPLNDAIKARDLFHDELAAFGGLDAEFRRILFSLLGDRREFSAFFRFVGFDDCDADVSQAIRRRFEGHICDRSPLADIIAATPVELAYCLSLIDSLAGHKKSHSITPPWVLKNYPKTERVMFRLRGKPCSGPCVYCGRALDPGEGLRRWFGFESFRSYDGLPLQERAVCAAIDNRSILAIFPSGGGKSITFQLPALLAGESSRGLTVVISPLQSLMKDQVDNLERAGITEGVTINGLLDPIERAKSIERVEDGSASILYISPESLRSRTMERLILGRKIARFVIDEAHCFSSWGHDFRVDYLYIGEFIRRVMEFKATTEPIPVSCFTATAKHKVIEDIRTYFREKLSIELELFSTNALRRNLRYKVVALHGDEEKYQALRELLEEKRCPTIVYVSRTYKAHSLARRLTDDGFRACAYHGKMEAAEKTANQNAFISGEAGIIVATSAFGMGVDKKDVGLVIHHDISDSIENYTQESGRAGRDENMRADCVVFFNPEDLDKHFILLNQTKLSIREIRQIWKALKDISRFRTRVSNSPLEIARKAGWDDGVSDMETRVTTAVAALEEAGYLKRGQNMPQVFANSIRAVDAQEAADRIMASGRFDEAQKEKAIRIIKKLFASRSRRSGTGEIPESRIDHIGDHLGILKGEVIAIVNLLREEGILADAKDLTAFIRRGESRNRSMHIVATFLRLERLLLSVFGPEERTVNLKELNQWAESEGLDGVNTGRIKTIFNFWAIKGWISRRVADHSKNHISAVALLPATVREEKLRRRHDLAMFAMELLYEKSAMCYLLEGGEGTSKESKEEVAVEFSVLEIKEAFENSIAGFGQTVTAEDVEETLFYLSRIEAVKLEGGFLVLYNRLTIERVEQNNHKQYTREDYRRLGNYYDSRVQQIHIVGEYARKMMTDPAGAMRFVEDYFQMPGTSFLSKYFDADRQVEIRRNITPDKFRQLFGELSGMQKKIINDHDSKYIAVAAGPGSGKTRVLVHKLASLLLMEDVKHEQLLMLTFSRAAATEFKKRLLALIGNAANFIEIKTFHSYCFDLLGRVGSLEKSDVIIKRTIGKIASGEVEANRITKTVLVVDEAQDMDEDEFNLIRALMARNDEMRMIAVGDDDQNIFGFRGADSKYFERFIAAAGAQKYELVDNYRSKNNLVEFTNRFVARLDHRLKQTPIVARQTDNGRIRIVRYRGGNLTTPLTADLIATRPRGTACVLTKTNEEALQITGALIKGGLNAQLIQSNEGFNMFNMAEVRYFLERLTPDGGGRFFDSAIISDEVWAAAKQELAATFATSTRLAVCSNLIRDFEAANPKRRYRSDFDVFVRESRLEDFVDSTAGAAGTVFVSTIHKAKGREFDNVWLMLDNFNASGGEAVRQLYVAMTRARQNLTIHVNSDLLDDITVEGLDRVEEAREFAPPAEMTLHLTHKDIWLDYFTDRQELVGELRSGDVLDVRGDRCYNAAGQPVLKFSRGFVSQLELIRQRGYRLCGAAVNFVVYWLREDTGREFKILLPELRFASTS